MQKTTIIENNLLTNDEKKYYLIYMNKNKMSVR